ncbi:MAG: peptidoglycan DD-metalloendopeptidase family protein [Nocardioides sp.]|nr:peptidoglycan DD-metalloendopeptidase family protein [Nocardioides sp.]
MTAVLAAIAVAVGVVVVPLAAADELKDRQGKVQRELRQQRNDAQHSSEAARRASRALSAAENKLGRAQSRLATTRGELTAARILDTQMQDKLDLAVRQLAEARRELRIGKRKVVRQEVQISRFAATSYQSGDPGLVGLAMVLRSEDPNDLTTQLNAVGNLMDREATALDRLVAARVALEKQEQEVSSLKDSVEIQRAQAAANLERRTALEQQASRAAVQVAGLVSQRESAFTSAEATKQADMRELRRLEAEQQRISAVLKRRAEQARLKALRQQRREERAQRQKERRAQRTGKPAPARPPAKPTTSGGFLSKPVNGYVTSGFGYRTHPIYGYRSLHDGVDFGAGCGQPLFAPASGRVVSRYYQSAWGNRLILDHGYQRGRGLATIFNHATRYTVGVGQRVSRGQVVGYVGTTGWSTGCHLHFTVMANGRAVNPMNWL